uniref:Uncharacterized protein n=1 Tax=Anguilla anguilla TaxID=7936 RepID=A0A0E9X242_ANGAN
MFPQRPQNQHNHETNKKNRHNHETNKKNNNNTITKPTKQNRVKNPFWSFLFFFFFVNVNNCMESRIPHRGEVSEECSREGGGARPLLNSVSRSVVQ